MRLGSLQIFLIVSLSVHILFMGTVALFDSATRSQDKDTITISLIEPTQAPKNALTKKEVYRPANQIVEQNEKAEEVESPDARFLSAKNQKVVKQTVATERGEFKNVQKATRPKSGSSASSLTEEVKKQIAQDIFKSFDAKEAFDRQKTTGRDSPGSDTDKSPANGNKNDVSQSNDYIKDVEAGLETVLNTREFKYYSYYNRIRRQLSQHWEGRVREKLSKLFKDGRAPAATSQDRITKLMIVLNEKGTLVRVQLLGDSGIRDLDDAAIEAFRAAAPFPNPPNGIVEEDGTVKIRWDFVLEV